MTKWPRKGFRVPIHLHRPRNNPNTAHQRFSVAVSNSNRGRDIKPITLPKVPWIKETQNG